MDFVQRNLINERNNLQIELAKAKLLIAELSEEKEIVGQQAPQGEKPKAEQGNNGKYEPRRVSPVRPSFPTKKGENPKAEQGTNGKYEPRRVSPVRPSFPTKNGDTTSKPTNEQAEYISDLENVIISIAEQLGVHPNDLLNELNVGGAIKSGFKAGGVMNAIKAGANAVGHNIKKTLRGGSVVPTAANRADSTAKQVGAYYDQAKTAANPDGGDAFEVGMADKHVKIAGKALQGVRKITNNRGMDNAVSPALDSI